MLLSKRQPTGPSSDGLFIYHKKAADKRKPAEAGFLTCTANELNLSDTR